MNRTRVAVVGCGHLGSIHARLLAARADTELVAVVDPSPEARERVAAAHGCRPLAAPGDLVGLADAVVVAAPTFLHADVSLPLLEAGVDLLVEKPIALDVASGRRIVETARRRGRIVAVGHVERFNPAWDAAVDRCGRVVAVEACRLAPFTFRSLDVGAVLDIMIHDIDLVLSLEPGGLERVESHGLVATGDHEDAARARLTFSSGLVADLTASRIHPSLIRRTSLWGTRGTVSVDFNAKTVDVVSASPDVLGGRFDANRTAPADRAGLKERFFTDTMPRETVVVPEANAIACEHDDFLAALRSRGAVRVPASAGLAAVEVAARILEAMVRTRLGDESPAGVAPTSSAAASASRRKVA
jgi:predicted dehydrogenase